MNPPAPAAVFVWIWFCVLLNCAGWALSALHELNAAGYAVVLLLGATALFFWQKKSGRQIFPRAQKIRRRFRRTFPLAYLILAALALLGGILYAPNNYDGLTYRLPRILHWLAEERWHWIHSIFPRVNGRACGIEWVSAPFLSLLKTDRLLFLINFVSFLLLPGLIFSVFTRLGVRRRTAWHWMWIAPTGYCFLLQAGSIGNDLFGAPFVLAAVDFALRAKKSGRMGDFFMSVLAAALMTGAKTSNLPLLLPWAVAIWPALKSIRHPLWPTLVGLVAIFASALPILVADAHFYNGDWSGLSAEGDNKKGHLLLRTAANATLMTVQNFTPPVFPPADAWNQAVQNCMPAGLNATLHQIVTEPSAAEFRSDELQIEENAGLGFGVSILLLASWLVSAKRPRWPHSANEIWLASLRTAPLISLLALLSQSDVTPLARILTPYYLLLLPLFLTSPAHEPLTRRRGWRISALAIFSLGGILVILSPARPLFPRELFLDEIRSLATRHPDLARVADVYATYRDRSTAFAPALAALPPNLEILGLITYDDPETSLWQPLGSRRIEHVCPEDTAADLKARGIGYILVNTDAFQKHFPGTPAAWLGKINGQVIQKIPLRLRLSVGTVEWDLVKLN